MEYNIHGGMNTITGDVERMVIHGGVTYIKGNVVTIVQSGGVMYDQRPSNRVEYRTDRMSDEERSRYRRRIAELENRLSKSEVECLKLRKKLDSSGDRLSEDDVLVAKIESLQCELANEREERRREVEDLKERIEVALEINAKLRHKTDGDRQSQEIADRHVDILASLMALYPFTPDKDLVLEFNLPADRIREVARVLGVVKSTEARKDAVEYLRNQHIEFIQRRGGDQGNHVVKPVEKIAKNGRVVKTYKSIADAHAETGHSLDTIRDHCKRYNKKTRVYTREGYTFRYKT